MIQLIQQVKHQLNCLKKNIKLATSSEEKNHLTKRKDAEMKSQQIIEEKKPIKNIVR
jgi:hypothetical protein